MVCNLCWDYTAEIRGDDNGSGIRVKGAKKFLKIDPDYEGGT
jgi:hypothetical protein